LNGDSDRNVFGHVSKLMPKWDEHICFKASCALCKDGMNFCTFGALDKKFLSQYKKNDNLMRFIL
jgi:hypothetical protein